MSPSVAPESARRGGPSGPTLRLRRRREPAEDKMKTSRPPRRGCRPPIPTRAGSLPFFHHSLFAIRSSPYALRHSLFVPRCFSLVVSLRRMPDQRPFFRPTRTARSQTAVASCRKAKSHFSVWRRAKSVPHLQPLISQYFVCKSLRLNILPRILCFVPMLSIFCGYPGGGGYVPARPAANLAGLGLPASGWPAPAGFDRQLFRYPAGTNFSQTKPSQAAQAAIFRREPCLALVAT